MAPAPAVPPTVFVPRVTCVHDQPGGAAVALGELTGHLLEALDRRLAQLRDEGAAPVVEAYGVRREG